MLHIITVHHALLHTLSLYLCLYIPRDDITKRAIFTLGQHPAQPRIWAGRGGSRGASDGGNSFNSA